LTGKGGGFHGFRGKISEKHFNKANRAIPVPQEEGMRTAAFASGPKKKQRKERGKSPYRETVKAVRAQRQDILPAALRKRSSLLRAEIGKGCTN